MRISTQWLNELVETPSVEELGHVFEMAGIGVEDYDADSDVWTLEVTSNRGDWLSANGLAREIAAMTGKRFGTSSGASESTPALEQVSVEIENPEECARYCALLIEGVTVGDSPEWLQNRLIECGMRPVNNIVDVTNFVMLERGQPLHAFDADKVLGQKIIVRRAKNGETITTLDEVERELSGEILVIADAENPIAVAGVMGGRDSEVTENTTRILLESAHFAGSRVRRGARVLGLTSEASRRFARWVDPNGVLASGQRAAQLIAELAGGTIVPGATDVYPAPVGEAHVALRVARCNAILGIEISAEQITALLQRLGMKVNATSPNTLQVSIPTWRRDVEREIDLIEEVARLYGYKKIPTTLPRTVNAFSGRNLVQRTEDSARETLTRCGLNELVTYSLENAASVARAGLDTSTPVVQLRNPLSDDYTQLRTSLFPSLLEILRRNSLSDATTSLRFFELAKIYCPQETSAANPDGMPTEKRQIGIALLAAPPQSHWQKDAQPEIDFFTLKGIVENVLRGIGVPPAVFRAASTPPFHPGRCATLSIDGENLGYLGEVHPDIAERYELRHRAYLASIDFESLVRHISIVPQFSPFSNRPAADRDIALVIPEKITVAQLENTIARAASTLLESSRVFDIYTGSPIEAGFKSVAVALRLRSSERTLQEEEIEATMTAIRAAAEKELGAQLRS
jgi:phenylalanyl-tRNA synthetase beta chain